MFSDFCCMVGKKDACLFTWMRDRMSARLGLVKWVGTSKACIEVPQRRLKVYAWSVDICISNNTKINQ